MPALSRLARCRTAIAATPLPGVASRPSTQSASGRLCCSVICGALLGLPWAAAQASEDGMCDVPNERAGRSTSEATPLRRSPWLFVPLVSSNPKLGTSLGGMVGYVHKFDATSEPSLLAVQAQRSNSNSRTLGVGGKAYWNENRDQLQLGIAGGNVSNDYLDFLGTGQEVRSQENLRGYFLRYQHQAWHDWYAGAQALYSNYDVEGSDPASAQILDLAGLAGEVAAGMGIIVSYDSRDNSSNPTRGALFQLHNFAFRDTFGSDSDFDVATGELKMYRPTNDNNVMVFHGKWRWTGDAPESKQSTVELRGYTRGQYLGRSSLTFEAEDRYMFWPRWGAKVFAGVSCLYGDGKHCSGDNLYPMAGAGIFYVVKPESNMVITSEFAKGNGDNRGFYVNFGHRF